MLLYFRFVELMRLKRYQQDDMFRRLPFYSPCSEGDCGAGQQDFTLYMYLNS